MKNKDAEKVLREIEAIPCVYGPPPTFRSANLAQAVLVSQSDQYPGHVFPIRDDSFMIGRDASCQVRLNDQMISRRHLEIRRTGTGYIAICHGLNGAVVSDTHMTSRDDPMPLRNGAMLDILGNRFLFRMDMPAPAAQVLHEVEEMITVYGPPPVFSQEGNAQPEKKAGFFQRIFGKNK